MKRQKKRSIGEIENIIDNMPIFGLARWYALIDAIDIIDKKSKEQKINFSKINIKPSAIEKYIEATCDIFYKKIEEYNKQKEDNINSIIENIIYQKTKKETLV